MKLYNVLFMLIAIAGIIGFFSTWLQIDDQMRAMMDITGITIDIPKNGLDFTTRAWQEGITEMYALIGIPIVFAFIALYHTGIFGKWHILIVKLIELLPLLYIIALLWYLQSESQMTFEASMDLAQQFKGMIGWGIKLTVIAAVLLVFDPVRLKSR